MVCYINIVFLCLAAFFCLERDRDQTVAACISGSITLILLIVVFTYHVFTEFCSNWKHFLTRQKCQNDTDEQGSDSLTHPDEPTHSEVDRPTRGELPLLSLVEGGEFDNQTDEKSTDDSDLTLFAIAPGDQPYSELKYSYHLIKN